MLVLFEIIFGKNNDAKSSYFFFFKFKEGGGLD